MRPDTRLSQDFNVHLKRYFYMRVLPPHRRSPPGNCRAPVFVVFGANEILFYLQATWMPNIP
jgi:hypothetical protein